MNTKLYPNDNFIQAQAKFNNLEVERHRNRYTFYTKDFERTLGTYRHAEASAFIEGYNEACRILERK